MTDRGSGRSGFVRSLPLLAVFALLVAAPGFGAGKAPAKDADSPSLMKAETFKGLELRNLGPALMSGRIADIAIDPRNGDVRYVAVGSGGVWKTVNAGTTWTPVFDHETSYSIGCVTLDPGNPDIVWVGTGENVGGRHVGYGDGVYRSEDGGGHWEKRGLEKSEHISRIVVDPKDPNTVWVAAQGPLWSPGGERGVYKTTDDGKTWKKVLGGGEWTGATDLVIDPRDPDRLYAALWQHQRTVAALIDGGPESGIWRSEDGGDTWTKLKQGLPEGNLGKIGLAVSPQKPDVLYAAIELDRRKGGVWRSDDRGASWEKRSDTVSGGTGPHYYQELYASPHAFDRLYLTDVWIHVSDDGGKTFREITHENKHSDNHAIAFLPNDPNYLMVGTDGGLYETFDLAATWRFVANLPVTQIYKLAVDDSKPFYNVYGGTQDNSTQGGPSRTDTVNGIRNADWWVPLFADGYQPATEPGNPDVFYAEWQEGNLMRIDRITGEQVYIQPQPEPGDAPDRFNWDAPILVSPHSATRLYYASQRVWRSDDRGDSWKPVSGDLTRDQDRLHLKMMGRQWSVDSPWDLFAMSNFGTITSLAESPLAEGLLYAGTDDGMLAVSEDGGGHWRSIDVGTLPGAASDAFVNDVKADLFDADTVYVALDHHKTGDFAPYLYESDDRGRTWRSIAGDLPARHVVWRLVQDDVDRDLLFAGTEYGIYFTVDHGKKWIELTGGVPTIPFRDLAIQRREHDLVGASFGRGFWVLDDYTPLRGMDEQALEQPAKLFPVRHTWWYLPRRPLSDTGPADQGAAYYVAPNPPFGAVFTYYLKDDLLSREKARQESEKPLAKAGKDTPVPSWEELESERREAPPAIVLVVRDGDGRIVRRVTGPATKGFHRVAWDLRYPPTAAITEAKSSGGEEDGFRPQGALAPPGRYTVTLAKFVDGRATELGTAEPFEVEKLRDGALPAATPAQVTAFARELDAAGGRLSAAAAALEATLDRVDLMKVALDRSTAGTELDGELEAIRQQLLDLDTALHGNASKTSLAEPEAPTVERRLQVVRMGTFHSTYGPTPNLRRSLDLAEQGLTGIEGRLKEMLGTTLPAFEQKLAAAGVPWTPGRPLP
jgi:photosystem II stability/assembly factor-like uncharacterized protein